MAGIACRAAWVFRAVYVVVATGLLLLGATASLHAQEGTLQSIRNDVREGPPPSPAASSPPQSSNPQSSNSDDSSLDSDTKTDLFLAGAVVVGGVLTLPIWAPIMLSDDDYSHPAYLHQFPYDDTTSPPETFPFAVRFDADYVDAFDNLDRINGHLLISTASRFEFDARCQHLAERLAGGGEDQLWNGDCNVTYRFAQSDFGQFRAGLGINWLNDPTETNLGLNFTYGADIFPAKPWVFSAVLDAGTLGHAGLFRFRTTAGVVYRSVELYTGYEYTDIGSVHWNGLIGGVRLWF
jgi:hypothetical protein